ncbi:MAG: Trm112 family protein [Planctomycetota bacterium]
MSEGDEILDPEFLEILRCPGCGGRLASRPGALVCQGDSACGLEFPVIDGIPRLVLEEARRSGGEG